MTTEQQFRTVTDTFIDLLRANDFAAAGLCFAPDGWYSHQDYDGTERQDEARGPAAIAQLLSSVRGPRPWKPKIHTFIGLDDLCILEGDRYSDGEWTAMFVAALTVDDAGLITSLIVYWVPANGDPLPPSEAEDEVDSDLMKATLARYIAAMESSNFEDLRQILTDHAVYSHPAYDPEQDPTRADTVGRDAIIEMTRIGRGNRSWFHDTERFVTYRNRIFILGVARDGEDGPTNYSYLGAGRFEPDGRLNRWIGYGSTPPAGASLSEPAATASASS